MSKTYHDNPYQQRQTTARERHYYDRPTVEPVQEQTNEVQTLTTRSDQ